MASMVRSTAQMVDSSRSAADFQRNKLSLPDEALIHQILNAAEINGFKKQGTVSSKVGPEKSLDESITKFCVYLT
jgi:hypothetical protein